MSGIFTRSNSNSTRFFTDTIEKDALEIEFFTKESCCITDLPCLETPPMLLCNPSFEGTPVYNTGNDFNSNIQCWRQFTTTTPDILPVTALPFLNITTAAFNGATYVGMQALGSSSYDPGEAVWQQLTVALSPLKLYKMSLAVIDLTAEAFGSQTGYGRVELWAGTGQNTMIQLLWSSPDVSWTGWAPLDVTFTPDSSYSFLFIRVVKTLGTGCYIGVDNTSEIESFCLSNPQP